MSETPQKKKVGRPTKIPTIHPTKFKGIGTPANPIKPTKFGVIEWTYTEIKTFNNIMKTLKSCEIETMKLCFAADKIMIEGITNQYVKSTKTERKTKLCIDARDTYSYYVKQPIKFIINMTEWATSLEDMDESCDEFTIVYRSGDDISIEIKNASVVCAITNRIKIEKIETGDIQSDNTINAALSNYVAKIINIKACNLKTLLGKNSRKTAQESQFQLRDKMCQFDFTLSPGRTQTVTFDVYSEQAATELRNRSTAKSKEQFYVVSRSEEMYCIKFPCVEIHKFLLHMKNDMIEIYFCNDCVIVQMIKPRIVVTEKMTQEMINAMGPHSTFTYYIPLSNQL